jgi:hypothetical protein
LLFGEVVAEESSLSQYVRLLYDKAEVVFARTLPEYAPNSYAALDSVGETGDVVGRHGGSFLVAAPHDDVYLLGVRIRGTGVVETIQFVPLRARIAATTMRCVYVGTIVLHTTASNIEAEIRDDLHGALVRSTARSAAVLSTPSSQSGDRQRRPSP